MFSPFVHLIDLTLGLGQHGTGHGHGHGHENGHGHGNDEESDNRSGDRTVKLDEYRGNQEPGCCGSVSTAVTAIVRMISEAKLPNH